MSRIALSRWSPKRRSPGRAVAWAMAGAVLLAGCGFQLRQPAELPYARVALAGFARNSAMAEVLAESLPANARMVEAARDADVVVVALDDRLTRTVVASTAAGQVREFRLRVTLKFRFTGPDGHVLGPDAELEQSRDLSYTETAALGKEDEERLLEHEMRADIAAQLLRMLSASGRAARRG